MSYILHISVTNVNNKRGKLNKKEKNFKMDMDELPEKHKKTKEAWKSSFVVQLEMVSI